MSDESTKKASTEKLSSAGVNFRKDLMVLTKIRLNTFVLITTLFGFVLGSLALQGTYIGDIWKLLHALFGTALAAFGSAAFNQLMEIEQDRLMKRTADRPLPSRRMSVVTAFSLGWVMSAFGVIHLAAKVNVESAYLAAVTIATYVFVYTPLKRKSSVNTLVGAIPGAIPPVIGWVAAGGYWLDPAAWYLFALLFLWQLPHFVAINWLCREEYESAGYVMWSNGDTSGKFTAKLAMMFSIGLASLGPIAWVMELTGLFYAIGGTLAGLYMAYLAYRFSQAGDRQTCRALFLYTLLYLLIALGLLTFDWDLRPIEIAHV